MNGLQGKLCIGRACGCGPDVIKAIANDDCKRQATTHNSPHITLLAISRQHHDRAMT
jgi:hypothetical protein